MYLDVHTHVVPENLTRWVPDADKRWPCLEIGAAGGVVTARAGATRQVPVASWSVAARLAAMEAAEVSGQVLSPMPALLVGWAPPSAAAGYHAAINEWIASKIGEAPDRLRGLGIVPMQDPELAADKLDTVAALGLSGVLVGSSVRGATTASPAYYPVFNRAAELGLCVFVHAYAPRYASRVFPPAVANAIALPLEIAHFTVTAAALGIAARFPELRIGVSHGGGGAAALLPRLDRAWRLTSNADASPLSPSEAAGRQYYDSLVHGGDLAAALTRQYGPERVLFGTDFPFVPYESWLFDGIPADAARAAAQTFLGDPEFCR